MPESKQYREVPNGLDVLNRLAGVTQADEVTLALDDIRRDGDTQSRVHLDMETIRRYADAMSRGDQFPAVEVIYVEDTDEYYLWDGFHRVQAAHLLGKTAILAKVRPGTQRDAQLLSVSVNETHGLPRSNEDKRLAVMRLLEDDEWSQWSDREIARQCRVSAPYVGKLREELSVNRLQMEEPTQFMTPERRKELLQFLSRGANEAMDAIADDMSLTAKDLGTLLDLEYQGRQRPAVVKFLNDAIQEESRPAPGAVKPAAAPPAPPQPEVRTVQRGGQTYQQKVSGEKRSLAAQVSRPPAPAPTPAPHYVDKPRVGMWRIRDEQDWLNFSDRMMELLAQDDGSGFEIEVRKA